MTKVFSRSAITESALKNLQNITPHLAFARGYAFLQLKRYDEALKDFEFVINEQPDYAVALDHAAHCAFILNHRDKGIKYAKEARKQGDPRAYNEWKRGEYDKKH